MLMKKLYLKKIPYNIDVANNVEIGIEKYISNRYDLVLMYMKMPVMDGYTACQALRKSEDTQDIPIIMLTSVGFELNKKLAASFGSREYVTKPFNLKELLDKISKCLQRP